MALIIDLKDKILDLTPDIYYLIKVISISELILVIILVFLLFISRVIIKFKHYCFYAKQNRIISLLDYIANEKSDISKKTIKLLRKNIWIVIDYLSDNPDKKNLILNKNFITKVLQYKARSLAKSNNWLKNYIATQCYYYGIDQEDEPLLIRLINHEKKLVCLGAAMVIFKYPATNSINSFIDSISKHRRINQAFFIEILSNITEQEKKKLAPFFINRLTNEKDPYIRSFCYRLAAHLTILEECLQFIRQDLISACLDLKLAAIYYLALIPSVETTDILISLLDDNNFEVRAVAAKLLGKIKNEKSLIFLEKKLKDPAWWVRINTAESLSKLGDKGIFALRNQDPKVDRFAYEAAQKILITIEHNKD